MAEAKVRFGSPVATSRTQLPQILKKFLVHFRRPSDYDGTYGFDWLRDEYIHPIKSVILDHSGNTINAALNLCENTNLLKTKYKKLVAHNNDYYGSWLTMFPNTIEANTTHSASIQTNGIDLDIDIETLETLISDDTEIIFENENPFLKITPEKLMLKNLITGTITNKSLGGTNIKKYYSNSKKINIKSDGGVFENDEEIKVFAKLDSQKVEVGKLMVCKNNDYNDYTTEIYVIKSYLRDDPNFSKTIIDTELAKIGGIQGLEDYLNQKSMNQSLIKVKLIYDQSKDWVFRKQSLINASNQPKYNGMIQNQSTMLMSTGRYMDYINDRFKLMYPNLVNKNAVFLYITPFTSPTAGGASYNAPLDSKHIIIFKNNIDHLPSYAHEIGHNFGLEHSFEDDPTLTNAILLANAQADLAQDEATKISTLTNNRAFYNANPERRREDTKILDNNIQYRRDNIIVLNNNLLRFSKKATENIMDYDLSNQKVFFKWQSDIMKPEVKTYYH
ncbi:matrixin family metalloprotease [Psychroserpens sp. NJDZ02]|uniref:matrixin family metalloprotease n=1 Tax=Psychroserpens sp. NJDZ02 TaxID=2570561 RepID=UPI0010A7A37A|nr:matrixin family metalloprotease [Psychroserpens sp. NJDZ02]QCE42460.1 matrixin family metalloprotease [Psychroserpens sp. NJDZ02]